MLVPLGWEKFVPKFLNDLRRESLIFKPSINLGFKVLDVGVVSHIYLYSGTGTVANKGLQSNR